MAITKKDLPRFRTKVSLIVAHNSGEIHTLTGFVVNATGNSLWFVAVDGRGNETDHFISLSNVLQLEALHV